MLQLNIYEDGKVKKTYETDCKRILYGTIEDLTKVVDIDKISADGDGKMALGKSVIRSIPIIRPMLKEVFHGITEEEIRHAEIKEVISIVMELMRYEIGELLSIGDSQGN